MNKDVIERNTDIIQPYNSNICSHLCLYVLKEFYEGWTFRRILSDLSTKYPSVIKREDLPIQEVCFGNGIKWSSSLADELHRPVRKKFPKRFVFVRKVDDIWGADLIDMQSFSKQNKGFKYILMVMDVFSKYDQNGKSCG